MNTPEKYPRTLHWPESETIHADDKTHTDPEFFIGKQVVITEKLDGGNTCLYNGKAYARSTTMEAGDGWFAMVKKHHAWKTTNIDRYAYYGEDLYGIHSIEYDALDEGETFRLFAVLDNETNMFLPWEEVVQHAVQNDFLTVPVIHPGGVFFSVQEITDWFKVAMEYGSELGDTTEGFVLRLADEIPFDKFGIQACKYVRRNHVQTDQHWRKNWKACKLT